MIESLINDSLIMIKYFDEGRITHVFREGNRLVGFYENKGVILQNSQAWERYMSIPMKVLAIFYNDVSHELQD